MLTEKKEANFFVNNYFRKKNFIIKFLKGEGPKYTYGNLLQRNDRPSDKFQKVYVMRFQLHKNVIVKRQAE